jgi:hypothetical protein
MLVAVMAGLPSEKYMLNSQNRYDASDAYHVRCNLPEEFKKQT